jgi:hypothetical protein
VLALRFERQHLGLVADLRDRSTFHLFRPRHWLIW